MEQNEQASTMRETLKHIGLVQKYLTTIQNAISTKLASHDKTKFDPEEFDYFVKFTPKLSATTYGSEEYRSFLKELQPALQHHYLLNSHHPEHFVNGINGMTLVDLLEMICDWKAASQRHADGDINKSIETSAKRFAISEQLTDIIKNTVKLLG